MTAHIFTVNHITTLATITLTLDQPNRSQGFLNFQLTKTDHLTLKLASPQVVETSVTNNSPSQGSTHADYHFQSSYTTMLIIGE